MMRILAPLSRASSIGLEAPTGEANLPQRIERAYFGHEAQKVDVE